MIPVFWDHVLAKKIALIQAAGAHYASHSSIAVVNCAFANATTHRNIPDDPDTDIPHWLAAGYTTELMVNAGRRSSMPRWLRFQTKTSLCLSDAGPSISIQPRITWQKGSLITRQRRMADLLRQISHFCNDLESGCYRS